MKKCKRCGHVKNWSGSNIVCPFQNSDTFSDNWNCGIIGKIRRICDAAMDCKDYRLHYQYCDDQKYVTIKTDCISLDWGNDDDIDLGLCLWVTWYKSRGATEQMWILSSDLEPYKPTYQQLEKIAEYYKGEGVV